MLWVLVMSQSTSTSPHGRNAQLAFAISVLCFSATATIAVLSVPFSINLYGVKGLWMPTLLLIPMTLQGLSLFFLKRVASTAITD